MCMFCSEYTYCVHTYISCGPECACVYVYVYVFLCVCSVYIRKCLYICTHVQPLLEEVGVGVVVHALPFAHLSMQYKTEADKKGFCFICHIAAYEFERRADVSGLWSRIHTACCHFLLLQHVLKHMRKSYWSAIIVLLLQPATM